jgi:arginyl-tRNA synthetase
VQLKEAGELNALPPAIQIENTKDKQHGDFATNIAMTLAKTAQKKPREIAERLIQVLPASALIKQVEIAGPGFINFFLSPEALTGIVKTVLQTGKQFGHCEIGRQKKVLVEFLSSNPTGPLHVGHGRHAAYGLVICNLLDAVGFDIYRVYYLYDAGRQVDILTVSVWLRYLTLCGQEIVFPENAYRGDYVVGIAKAMHLQHGDHFLVPAHQVFDGLPPDEPQGGDKEQYIDAVIARAKSLLGDKYQAIYDLGLENIVADMREDLAEFGVHYDNWFSERQFTGTGIIEKLIERLRAGGYISEREGAIWFRSTELGDSKDRVLVRSNGQLTYFANDVAYHLTKFDRGFDIAIDIFGADHHGYVPRMKAAMEASGINPERLVHQLVQFVTLYRGNQQVSMSTRGGTFVTLRELREEVGNDVARYFYVMRKGDQPIDFDLDLAKEKSNENPVYYVQYAYARICSVFKQMNERSIAFDQQLAYENLHGLVEPEERELLNTLSRFPDMIVNAALSYEPHQVTNYLRELAGCFHAYYNAHQFLVDDAALRNARLALLMATRQVLENGFGLLGITAPESM